MMAAKRLGIAVATFAILVAVLTLDRRASAPAQGPRAMPPSPVITAPLVQGDVAAGQPYVGTVMPTKRAVVGSAVDGRVVEFLVNEGDYVRKGQPLVRVLTDTIELELRGAEAELRLRQQQLEELKNGSRPEEIEQARALMESALARAQYSKARRDRAERLYQTTHSATAQEREEAIAAHVEAQQAYVAAKAAYALAVAGPRAEKIAQSQASVAVQQALVDRLKDQIEKFTIIGRFDGFITAELTEEGEWVKTGDPAVEMAALDEVDVQIYVVEEHIPFVTVGLTVRVEVSALGNKLFTGTVVHVVPQADVRARTFPVKVRVANVVDESGPLLKAGMSARVMLPTGPRQQALLAPKDAIVLGGPQPVVFVLEPSPQGPRQGTVRPVPVELGVASGERIQVSGDLEPEQNVVVQGNERLRSGQAVVVSGVQGTETVKAAGDESPAGENTKARVEGRQSNRASPRRAN